MKSYLGLIPLSARVRRRQNRMTVLCILMAVLLVTAFFSRALGEAGTVTILMVALLGGSAWIYLYSYLVFIGKMK